MILKELRSKANALTDANLHSMLHEAIWESRATVTDEEYNRMYAKLKQSLKVTVADDGALGIELTLKSL